MSEPSGLVYLVRCSDGSLYCGVTFDLANRLSLHNTGKGAKYTRSRLPVELVWSQWVTGHGAALAREAEIKKMSRKQKLAMLEWRR